MKKLIWIGEGCWFPDSLVWFKEHDVALYVVHTRPEYLWWRHYTLFAPFCTILESKTEADMAQIYNLLDHETLVLGGGNYHNLSRECVGAGVFKSGEAQLEVLYQISKYNKEHHKGAKVVRWFNGDTGFGNEKVAQTFTEKTKYVDTFMFDNDQLKEFIFANIPTAAEKECLYGWIETPLERFCYHNTGKIKRKICSLGRMLCSSPPPLV